MPNQVSWRDLSLDMLSLLGNSLSGDDLLGRQFRTLLAVIITSAQKGVGSFALIMLGLTISNKVRLRRSAAPFEADEYVGVES